MQRYAGIILLAVVMAIAAVYAVRTTPSTPRVAGQATTNSSPSSSTTTSDSTIPIGSGFDFYVLSLSWSPSYCLTEAGSGNRQQCGDDADYGLVVHGLWPQNEKGYPEFCKSNEPERVSERLGRTMLDIMPGIGLIGHQWRKHGTCSGLSQADYFRMTRAALERVNVPASLKSVAEPATLAVDEIERQFTEANPGLSRRATAVTCEDKRLKEVRICFSKDLKFRDCAEVDRRSCPLPSVTVPPIR